MMSVGFHGFHFLAEQAVLRRFEVFRVGLGRGHVGVDPFDVGADVVDRLLADLAVELGRLRQLFFEVGFGVGGEGPLAGVAAGVAAAEEGGEFGAAGVAQHVHQEEAVLGAGVAGGEHRVGAGFAVDVGNAEGFVADDRRPRARFDRRFDFGGRDAEGGVLEVVRDLFFGQPRRAVDEVFVERLLVGRVRRQRAEPPELEQLTEGVEPVLPGRQHVAEAAGVICPIRFDGSARRLREGGHDQGGQNQGQRQAPTDSTSQEPLLSIAAPPCRSTEPYRSDWLAGKSGAKVAG